MAATRRNPTPSQYDPTAIDPYAGYGYGYMGGGDYTQVEYPGYEPDSGNTGVTGHGFPEGTDTPVIVEEPKPPAVGYTPRLEGFDQGKLGDATHATRSPKYAFGQAVASGNYGFNDGSRLLADLQSAYPELFAGWSVQGDKFRFTGQPNQLHSSWEGADEVDYIRNFTQGGSFDPNAAAFNWGVSSPASRAAEIAGQFGAGGGGSAPQMGGGVGGGGYAGGGGSSRGIDIAGVLQQLLGTGAGSLNRDIITRRLDSARGNLDRALKSRRSTDAAILAERGLIGSGPEATALLRSGQDIEDEFSNTVQSIYADEARAADERMIQALSLATGMSIADARNAIESQLGNRRLDVESQLGNRGLDIESMLGTGNLALGNLRANMDWNQFMAQHGLNRDMFGYVQSSGTWDRMIRLLEAYLTGSKISADGQAGG